MNKNISFDSVSYFLMRASFIGISFKMMLLSSRQDTWISIALAIAVGIIPLFLLKYIASYKDDLTFKEKCVSLFPKSNKLVRLVLIIGILGFCIINFGNLINLTHNQFLDKTPHIAIAAAFIIPMILIIDKNSNVLARVTRILIIISLALFMVSFIGLVSEFDFDNFQPVMNNSILSSSLYFLGFNVAPLFLMLTFPDKKINWSRSYIIATLTLLFTAIAIIGILGVELALIYQYPEFHILKNSFDGVISHQLVNILAIKWIIDIFILCSICLIFCKRLSNTNKYFYPAIVLILAPFIVNDYQLFNSIVFTYSMNIIPILFAAIILLFSIKIFIKKSMA